MLIYIMNIKIYRLNCKNYGDDTEKEKKTRFIELSIKRNKKKLI